MPSPIAYPGNYTPEPAGGQRRIVPVPTSVTAFVGLAQTGPVDCAVEVRSLAEFQHSFGAPHESGDLGHSIGQFFENGGGVCWVVRVSNDDPTEGEGAAAQAVIGDRALGTGIYALESVKQINILTLPGITDPKVQAAAIAYAEERRAMVILDLPAPLDTPAKAIAWLDAHPFLQAANAAAYFPRLSIADPLHGAQPQSCPNSGLMAGLWARIDAQRGVWKAPAGTECRLRGILSLDYVLTDAENGRLNAAGINSLRAFPAFGYVSWGARTLAGADQRGSEWKYIPVRRLGLFIEESVAQGIAFAIFQPNDEALWAQIRLSVSAFMTELFRQGAFQGSVPRESFFVHCDRTTMSDADIAEGRITVQVGYAPLKPAEFVVLTIKQSAARS